MSDSKNVRIETIDGKIIKIPREIIRKITLPSLVIKRNYFKLTLQMQDYERELERIRKKFNL